MAGILLTGVPDVMIWADDKNFGLVTASIVYESLLFNQLHIDLLWWFSKIWKAKVPQKVKCFAWLVLKHKVLSWDLLQRRGIQGPNKCIMCKGDGESADHLFCNCPLFRSLWSNVCMSQGLA